MFLPALNPSPRDVLELFWKFFFVCVIVPALGDVLLSSLTLWTTYAYLTYEDVNRIPSLKDQTVMVIKAPVDTKLEVPHPEEVQSLHYCSF